MVKIRAKQLLDGRISSAFFSLLIPSVLSAVSLILTVAVLYFASSDETEAFVGKYLGEYANTGIISASVILCSLLLYTFASGKKLFYLHIVRITDKVLLPDCSGALKTMQFLIFSAVRFLFILAWSGLFLLPAAVLASIAWYFSSIGEMTVGMFNLFLSGGVVLTAVGLLFTFVTVQRYSMWGYALCRRGSGVFSALDTSLKKTDGQMLRIAFFKISMLPWILLCALVLPIIYVLPYYETAVALRLPVNERKRKASQEKDNGFAAVFTVKKRATE